MMSRVLLYALYIPTYEAITPGEMKHGRSTIETMTLIPMSFIARLPWGANEIAFNKLNPCDKFSEIDAVVEIDSVVYMQGNLKYVW